MTTKPYQQQVEDADKTDEQLRDELAEKYGDMHAALLECQEQLAYKTNHANALQYSFDCQIKKLQEARDQMARLAKYLKWCVDNGELVVYDYVGEYPNGGNLPFPCEWTQARELIASYEAYLKRNEKQRGEG